MLGEQTVFKGKGVRGTDDVQGKRYRGTDGVQGKRC